MSASRLWSLLLAWSLLWVVGCKTDATQIIVLVNTDFAVPAEVAGIDIRVETDDLGTLGAQSFDLSQHGLPLSFGVHASDGFQNATVRVLVAGVGPGGEIMVTRSALVTFEEEETLLLPMMLARVCAGQECTASNTCINGSCAPEAIAEGSLPYIDPGEELGYDAGPWPTGDGGISPNPDATGVDATADAGFADADAEPAADGDIPPEDGGTPGCFTEGCPQNQVCTNTSRVRQCQGVDPASECECRPVCAPLSPDTSQCSGGEQCAFLDQGPFLDFGACLEADGRGEQGADCQPDGSPVGHDCSATSSHVCVVGGQAGQTSAGLCARLCSMSEPSVCGDANEARCAGQRPDGLGICVSIQGPSQSLGRSCGDGNDCDTGICEAILANSCSAFCSPIDECPMGGICAIIDPQDTDGVCLSACTNDTECAMRNPVSICVDIGTLVCLPGCSATGCPNGGSCQPDGRCV